MTPPALQSISGRNCTPFSRRILSPSIVVGPLAASTISLEAILLALFALIAFYNAAGMKISLSRFRYVRLLIKCFFAVELFATWIAFYSVAFGTFFVFQQFVRADALGTVDTPIKLSHTDQLSPSLHEEL